MKENDIKKVVAGTVDILLHKGLIKYSDAIIYERMGERLKGHYKKPDMLISQALEQMKNDRYFEILAMYYKDNMTLEGIAEELGVDISTVVRNKKSLCIKLFELAQ